MSSSESDGEWSDVEEENEEVNELNTICLFSDLRFADINSCFKHMLNEYGVDFKGLVKKLRLDFYSYIKLINYIRGNKICPEEVKKLSSTSSFDKDCYLKPVIEDDSLLQYDIDEIYENNNVESTTRNGFHLEDKLAAAEKRGQLAEDSLERTIFDLERCRKELKKQILGAAEEMVSHYNETNEGYFESYAHHGIHEEMLKDKVRTESYKDFILKNPKVFKDAVVLDVGCGTSILSMFSAQSGAKQVFGVDNSDVAHQAMDIIRENRLEKVITILKGKAEDINMPCKVDVIISEWMGYFLLFESMLDTVIFCRDNLLNENGRIFPDKCNIQLIAFGDEEFYQRKVKFWQNVYGFKMSTMSTSSIEEPLMEIVNADKMLSKPVIIKEFDLMKISVKDLDFDAFFEIGISKDGIVSSIIGCFDIFFGADADEFPVMFSTSPNATPTHWKQTVFFLKEPIHCKAGDTIRGRIFVKKNKKDTRGLDVALIFFKNKENEILMRQHYVTA